MSCLEIIKNTTIELGTATSGVSVTDPLYKSVRENNFNMYVAENSCKFCYSEKVQGQVGFNTEAKQMISDAQASGKLLKLTPLAWNQQTAWWYDKLPVSQKAAALEYHVKTLAKASAGLFYKIDVVNEAIGNDLLLRPFFVEVGGEPFIVNCFKWAAEANPQAILVYNDYGITTDNYRSQAIRAFVQRLKAAGAPIHEVGSQCHEAVKSFLNPSIGINIAKNMQAWKDIGVRLNFSEVDLRIDFGLDSFTMEERLQKQAEAYYTLYKTALSRPDICNNVTLWQFAGKYSWIHPCYNVDRKYCAVPWGNDIEELPAVARIKDALREVAPLHAIGRPVSVLGLYGIKPWGTTSNFVDKSAQWIWNTSTAVSGAPLTPVKFKKVLKNTGDPKAVTVHIITDNTGYLSVNGKSIGSIEDVGWKNVNYTKLPLTLIKGDNILIIKAVNAGGPAGLLYSVIDNTTKKVLCKSDASTSYII
jgi:endo-1,4-beta-xylanase